MSTIIKMILGAAFLLNVGVDANIAEKVPEINESLNVLISKGEIVEAIDTFVAEFNQDQAPLTIICILKGAYVFTADLVRALTMPTKVHFIRCESYGMRGTTPGALTISGLDDLSIKGEKVLIVDDILDTGQTLQGVYHKILDLQPAKLETLVLLSKKREDQKFRADHALFEIEDHFVIGYGLDYKEWFRGLPDIAVPSNPQLLESMN